MISLLAGFSGREADHMRDVTDQGDFVSFIGGLHLDAFDEATQDVHCFVMQQRVFQSLLQA